AALLDQLELSLEHGRRHGHLIGRDRTEAMIEQDGNRGRVGGKARRADERQQANNGRQPSTNTLHTHLWAHIEHLKIRYHSFRRCARTKSKASTKHARPSSPCCGPRTDRSVLVAPCRG